MLAALATHPLASVSAREYGPAIKLAMSSLAETKPEGPVQAVEMGATPPKSVASMLPVLAPMHPTFQPPLTTGADKAALRGAGAESV